jgi:hypothetical protein
MRRHAKDMDAAMSFVQNGLSEEQMYWHKAKLVESFNQAQSAWEAYRAHLQQHGILPGVQTATHAYAATIPVPE